MIVKQENPYIIRYLKREYIQDFMESRHLMLSSFAHISSLEDPVRSDNLEGIIKYTNKSIRIIGDVTNKYLLLCASLTTAKRARGCYSSGIIIFDVNQLIKDIVISLLHQGYSVVDCFYGPCNYFGRDKSVILNSRGDSFYSLKDLFNKEDLFFMKSESFAFEHEYRIVFELDKVLNEDQVMATVSPNLVNDCHALHFKD